MKSLHGVGCLTAGSDVTGKMWFSIAEESLSQFHALLHARTSCCFPVHLIKFIMS